MSEIRNCKFSFKCPKDWEALERTDNMHRRYCGECNEIVHFCYTSEDLMKAIQDNLCVAISNVPSTEAPFMVGRLSSRYGEED